jgi:hypothetical protein
MTMHDEIKASEALDKLPIGAMVAAAFIDESDDTATVILFERRTNYDDEPAWWDLTRKQAWWSSLDIARGFDDMVITARPDADLPETKMTGRLRFRYGDGSYLEWSTKEPTTPQRIREVVTTYAALDRAAS